MRTGIYEPYRNHFPLKQSQVPACQTPRQALPYGAYDPTKAKERVKYTPLYNRVVECARWCAAGAAIIQHSSLL